VFLYGEPFTSAHLVSFGFIWAGLLLYSYDSLNTMRSIPFATGAVEEPEGFEI
jgi:chloramphenicol-sensitive protein RarD